MDLVFLGSGAFGLPTLQALGASHRIRGVVTQPDRPAGRGKAVTPTPIAAWAGEHLDAPLIKTDDVNEPAVRDRVRGLAADAWVVIAFGQKLSAELLDGVFSVNLHASLLPRWRGAAPINWAILGGDAETGNSVITLAERMDAGLVLGQSRRPIEPDQTAGDLHDLLASDGPALMQRVLAAHEAGTLEGVRQDESKVTLARKLSSEDRWVDFSAPATECRRRVHGLTPWPGVQVRVGGRSLKLLRVESLEPGPQSGEAGRLIDPAAGVVACGGGSALRLVEVQAPGKRPMAFGEYARGHALEPETLVEGGGS